MRSSNNEFLRGKNYTGREYFYTDSSTTTGQAITIEPYHALVVITLSDGTNTATATATLPPVAKAKGQRVSIVGDDVAGGITLQDQNDSENWTDLTIDTNADRVTLESNGRQWIVVENAIV